MRTLTNQQAAKNSAQQQPARTQSPLLNNDVRSRLIPSLSTGLPLLQRQCACGGGCPRCQEGLGIQTKLKISEPGDVYEQEADRIADQVMRMPDPAVQRQKVLEKENEERVVQRKTITSEGQDVSEVPSSVDEVLRSPGQPLDTVTRTLMESYFSQDFSPVRVHSDRLADQSARDVSAQAYTVGHNIVFGAGKFLPGTYEGQRLLAHELTHVVQQGGSTKLVQRQVDDELPNLLAPGTAERREPEIPLPDIEIDPTALSEPGCPRTPTRLGNLTPTPSCNEEGDDIDGTVFEFCTDSDIFRDPTDLNRLRTLVSSQSSGAGFSLRAYASIEGPGNADNAIIYNRNLSCHRLNRTIRELLNLGVQEQNIDAVSMGPTDQFGAGVAGRQMNRIVVIQPNSPQHEPRADASGMSMSQIRDAAKHRLVSGDYPLAADAYFARWSCGRWRTLAEAVEQTTVLIAGTDTTLGASAELGTTSNRGANTIVISPDIARSTDPIGCAANRIADLTFHHFSRPVLSNFMDQHRAGIHLVHLAGLPACRIPLDPLNTNFDVLSRPDPVDPFVGFIPRCADQPLFGSLPNQQGPATMEIPPTFTVTSLTLSGASGSLRPTPSSNPLTVGVEPDASFVVEASVDTVGATAASVANFEIGFIQTVMTEDWSNTHVDGRRERRHFPLPLRDGPARNHRLSEPPWFDTNSKLTASPGANQVTLTDAPNFRAFRFLPDIPSTLFVQSIDVPQPSGRTPIRLERPTFDPQLGPPLPADMPASDANREGLRRRALANNVPDRGHRVLDFNTWVVARRKNPPAPATHGATQFLGGLRLTFNLSANWSSSSSGNIMGSGSYNVSSQPATSSDADAMLLRGATPLDFVGPTGVPLFAEFLDIESASPRALASGLPRDAYFNAVRQIAQPHRTGSTMRGEVIIQLRIETETGRLKLDTSDLERGAIRILNTNFDEINTPETRAFVRTIFPEVRKLVVAPGIAPNEPQTGTIPVPIRLQPLNTP
jgi:hypothetical protein